ncbi:glycosyltransferase [Coprobacillus sp. AF02-13]|nr:glycosyltransferase [Coprobacillus sp. AF02-13]
MKNVNSDRLPKGTNIVIVNDFDYTQGGASKVAIDTANMLVEHCDDVNIYFFSGVHNDSSSLHKSVKKLCTNQGEALKDSNRLRGCINGIYNYKAKKELNKLLQTLDRNNTIIHIHGWTKILSSSIFNVVFKNNFKVVLTMHDYFTACPNGGYYNYKKNRTCYFKPLSWKCIRCNCDSRNYAFKIYRIIRQFVQNKIIRLNDKLENVISISTFSEKILKTTLNSNIKIYPISNPIDFDERITNDNFKENDYYLNVSRLSLEKGVEDFCKAVSIAGKKGIVVGDGPEKTKLEKKYPKIKFVGWKNAMEVKMYMKKARYLVFTTRLYEGSPLTTMEALMMGLPCIVWSQCAAKDQIVENESGFLYDDLDSLIDIIKNKELRNFNFSFEANYIPNLIDVYIKIKGE